MNPSIQRIGATARFSEIVIHHNTVYLAVQVSQLTEGDITAQSKDVFDKIDTLLAKGATDKSHLLSAQIWLADMADYDGLNQVWDAWLAGVSAPVRVCACAWSHPWPGNITVLKFRSLRRLSSNCLSSL